MSAPADADVLAAADRLVSAFGAHDRAAYFACFAPDATFVFHTTPRVLTSRAEFEAEWDRWERDDGFRVLECASEDRRVAMLGDAAILVHRVATKARLGNEVVESDERETIVFRREPSGWLAVHEHLSATPA